MDASGLRPARRDRRLDRPGLHGGGTSARLAAQVTYAPVSEFGFDVLRDRLVTDTADLIAGDPDVVLIDEADSVLIDEARVPLVLAARRRPRTPTARWRGSLPGSAPGTTTRSTKTAATCP